MTICWKYLDRQRAAIAAIKDWDKMLGLLATLDDEISELRDNMVVIGGQQMDGMPHVHNPAAFETRMVTQIAKITELERQQREAEDFLAWFVPAWDALSEEYQLVLRVLFLEQHPCGESVKILTQHLACTENAIYKRKRRAIDQLAENLFPASVLP